MAIDGPLGTAAIDAFQRNVQDLDRVINGDDDVTARPVGGDPGKTLIPYTQIVSEATTQANNAAASAQEAEDAAQSISVPAGQAVATVPGSTPEQVRTNTENDAAFVAGQAGTGNDEFRTNAENDARFQPIQSRTPISVWTGSDTEVTPAEILADTGHIVQPGKYWALDGSTAYSIDVLTISGNNRSQGSARIQSEASSNRVTVASFSTLGGFDILSFLGNSQTGTQETLTEIWFAPL